jgi:hypothetical protein
MALGLLTPQVASAGAILFLDVGGGNDPKTIDFNNIGNEANNPVTFKSDSVRWTPIERGFPAGLLRAEGSFDANNGILKGIAEVDTLSISSEAGYYFSPSYRADANTGLTDQLTLHANSPAAQFAPLHLAFDLDYALVANGGLPPVLLDGTVATGGDVGASVNFDITIGSILAGFLFNVNGVAGTGASWGLPDPSEDGVVTPFHSILASSFVGGNYTELLNVTEDSFGWSLNRAYTIETTFQVPVGVPFSLAMNSYASAGCYVRHNCNAYANFGNSLFASISTDPGFTLESAFGYGYTARAPIGEVTPVPEPGTLALVLAGLGACRAARRRHQSGVGAQS